MHQIRLTTRAVILFAGCALGACGNGSGLRATEDLGTTAPIDLTTSQGGCTLDSQCSGATPRCDKNTGNCVPCLPTNDDCPMGQRCVPVSGVYACTGGCTTSADCPRSDAGAAESCCANACIDTSSDSSNCGGCDKPCPLVANGAAACVNSACGLGTCNSGFADCDGVAANGCEVNRQTDAKNCGQCGKACVAGNNQSATCSGGSCVEGCAAGYLHCSANQADGCEVNGQTDSNNCGACGVSCSGIPNAGGQCTLGACVIVSCNFGFADCNQLPRDGCEVNTRTDINNCGACGKSCGAVPNGVGGCTNGACVVLSCDTGFLNCDGLANNGCEVPIESDPHNCGGCAVACAGANSVQDCEMAACTITSCAQGYADCDANPSNGCEVGIANDPMHCGGCAKVCATPANATATCANGTCGVGSCNFGYADCDKNPANGCEASLTSVQNCGQCGTVCSAPANASAGCSTGTCGIGMCNALYADCDKNPANGCEKSVATDLNNCGACGQVCAAQNGTPACLGGQCGITACNSGYADCDKQAANGCEVNLKGDPDNCGACGNVCPMNAPACSAGQCTNVVHNCLELLQGGVTQSGAYTIDPDGNGGNPSFTTYCDMTTAGGGWTLIVNRITESDDNGQGDLSLNTGTFDSTRATNFTFSVTPFYAGAANFVYAVKHDTACAGCGISQYDSAIEVPRSASATYTFACTATEAVSTNKLVGPGNGGTYTAYRCTGSLGWGACSGNVCHWGVNSQNTTVDGTWSTNANSEMHFPSSGSSYRMYDISGAYCRSCGGGLLPASFNPESSTCCDLSGTPDRSTWTVWVR